MSIKEIAKRTGASASTVSRVLNYPDHKCHDEKLREKIFQVARELHYIPNKNARILKKGSKESDQQKYLNVLVTRSESDPFFSEILRQIEVHSHNSGFVILNIWHHYELSCLSVCKKNDMDTVITETYGEKLREAAALLVLGKIGKNTIDALKKHCKYIVSLSRNYENLCVDEVICDGEKNASLAMEHLFALGHRNIAYVGHCDNESRFIGYQRALQQRNIALNLDYCFSCNADEKNGISAFDYFSKLPDSPTGIFCSNDIIAIGIIEAFSKNPYYNPSVISIDDIFYSQYCKPMLTTVHIPQEEMVKMALLLLNNRMEGGHESPLKLEFSGNLMIRESTANLGNTSPCEYYNTH